MIVSRKIASMFRYCGFVNIDYLVKNKLERDPSKILNILNRDWRKWVKPVCMKPKIKSLDPNDPTFGYTTVGGSSMTIDSLTMRGSLFTAPSDVGTANSISVYCGYDGARNVKGVLVLHSNLNIVGNGVGNPAPTVEGQYTWVTSSFSTPPSLTPNTGYVLMAIAASTVYMRFDTGETDQGHDDTSNSYASPTNPTDATHNTRKYSIYCTYTTGGAILKEVTDSLSLSDAVLRDKTLAVLDSLGLADVPLKSWTPQISDSIGLSDSVLRNKTFTVTDSISLSEIIEVITGAIIKYVEDSLGLSDAVKINKTLIISDVLGLLDQVFRHKPQISITDAIALAEVVAVSKLFTITDTISLGDVALALKQLRISDSISLADAVSTPTRILQALDAVGLSDNAYVNKTLIITDQIALAEVVEVGKGVAKTKLFLVIGDLAIQISG